MPASSARGFAHLVVLVLLLIVLISVMVSIWLLMSRPQTQEQLSQVQQVQAIEEIREAGASAVASVTPVESMVPTPKSTPRVTVSSTPSVSLDGGKTYNGRTVSFKYPSDWRYDNKNTSSKLFGELHLMNVMEFDKSDSKAIDPEGLLYGRIELKVFTDSEFAAKTADDYINEHFKFGSPEIASSRQIAGAEVKEVRHKNCGEATDCVDVIIKSGSSFYDWKILKAETKAEDLALVYAILNTAVYKWEIIVPLATR